MANSQLFYARALRNAAARSRDWLDLGCGHQFLPEWLPDQERQISIGECRVVGIDADGASLERHAGLRMRVRGTVDVLPFRNGIFDLVTANMVVEHLAAPAQVFSEVRRVLKPGGRFLVHTPNREGYTTRLTRCIPEGLRPWVANVLQGRQAEDVYPTYYRANTIDELNHLASGTGFTVDELQTLESSPQLYRVPVLNAIEERLLRTLRRDSLQKWRPCILATFRA